MARIEIREPRSLRETARDALWRVAIGAVITFDGAQQLLRDAQGSEWLYWAFWQRWLASDDAHTLLVLVPHVAAGLAIALGFLTRPAALVAAVLAGVDLWVLQQEYPLALRFFDAFEAPLVLFVSAVYIAGAGAGELSIDAALRERARRRAIQKDDIWLRPPYVAEDRVRDAG